MAKRNQHVVPVSGKWSVRSAGANRASGTYETQQEAVERARERARRQGVVLFIHGPDGRVREIDSYKPGTQTSKG